MSSSIQHYSDVLGWVLLFATRVLNIHSLCLRLQKTEPAIEIQAADEHLQGWIVVRRTSILRQYCAWQRVTSMRQSVNGWSSTPSSCNAYSPGQAQAAKLNKCWSTSKLYSQGALGRPVAMYDLGNKQSKTLICLRIEIFQSPSRRKVELPALRQYSLSPSSSIADLAVGQKPFK